MDRRGFVGGSDVAAILGLSPWKTAYELWEEKTAEIAPVENFYDEQREKVLRRGKRLEPIVIEMLQEEHDIFILDRNQIVVDPEYDWMRAEIDFTWAIDNDPNKVANGDVKTAHPMMMQQWGEEGTSEYPPYYAAQFMHGLGVSGRDRTLIAVLIGADDLKLFWCFRDDELITEIRRRVRDFWFNNVIAHIPPPASTGEDAAKMVSRFNGFVWEVTGDWEDPHTGDVISYESVIDRIGELKQGIKLQEVQLEKYKDAIKIALLEAAKKHGIKIDDMEEENRLSKFMMVCNGKDRGSFAKQISQRIDVKDLRAKNPAIATEFTKPSTSWVLRTK